MGSDEKQNILDQVEELESTGMAITRQWYELWSEAMRYMFSEQDYKLDKDKEWDWVIMNYIWPCAMQEIAKLAKNYPKILALPFNSDDQTEIDAAEVWQGVVQWQWQENLNMRLNQIAAIFCGKIYGYRVSYVYWEDEIVWDDKSKVWLGDVQYKLWNPAFFWADGDEFVNDGNCGTVRWAELAWAQARWPEYADELEKISISLRETASGEAGDVSLSSWMSAGELLQSESDKKSKRGPDLPTIVSLIKKQFLQGAEASGKKRYVRLSNTFLKDHEKIDRQQVIDRTPDELIAERIVSVDSEGRLIDVKTGLPYNPGRWPTRTVRKWKEPKYPYGRNVLSAGQGSTRLTLADSKWWYNGWPFVVSPHYTLPFMWQGINAVTLYKTSQDIINLSISHLLNNLCQFGDPCIDVEEGALALDPNKRPYPISSRWGSILRLVKNKLGSVRRVPPMPVSPAAMAIYQIFVQEFKNLTGLQAVGRGEQLRGGTTATETQILALSSNDRIYLQSVYEDEWCKHVAKHIAAITQQNYDVGRFVRIVGEGKIGGIKQITDWLKKVEYDITIIPGTTLPFDEEKRIMRYKMAHDLMGNPVPNPMLPEMLRVLDIANREKLLKEHAVYQKYRQFVDLYNQVKAGKIPAEQAVQMLTQAAMVEFREETGQAPMPQGAPQNA